MFMIANKSQRIHKIGLLLILWTSGLLSVPPSTCSAQKLPTKVLQRRFMWQQMDSSMYNLMDGVASGARAFKDMLGGMLPSSKISPTTHSYHLNMETLPTSTVRVRYIVGQPFTSSTNTKYRYPKPNKMFKDYMQNVTETKVKYQQPSQPLTAQYTFKANKEGDTQVPVYFQNSYGKSNRKTSKLVYGNQQQQQQPLNEIIIGKSYDDWTPVLRQNKQQQQNNESYYQNPTTAENYESEDYAEQLPVAEKLIRTTIQPYANYEVTENSPEASVRYEHKYQTSSGFIPLRTVDSLLPRLKGYTERYKPSYHHRTAKSLTQWLPVANAPRTTQLHFTPAPRVQDYTTSTTTTIAPTTEEIIYESYTRKPYRELSINAVQPTLRPSREPAVTRSSYKPRDVTQRGSIKFGDKLTDI